jgi:hypothetical protein
MAVFTIWFGRSARIDDDAGTPVGINVAVGAVTISVAMAAAASVPVTDPQWRCAVVALAVGLFAMGTSDGRAVALIVLPAWMVMNGFLIHHQGELSWQGWADLDRVLVLATAGGIGLAVAAANRELQEHRERWQLGAAVQAMRTAINEETKHRA